AWFPPTRSSLSVAQAIARAFWEIAVNAFARRDGNVASGLDRLAKEALDDHDVAPGAVQPGMALVNPDLAEAQAAQHRAAGFVLDEDAADQLPEAGGVSGGQQRFHRGAAGAAAALGARDIDRELGD